MTSDYQYVWLLWSSAFLVPWALLYFLWPALRTHMLRVSAATSLLGVTMYWSGLYEHFSWRAIDARTASTLVPHRGHHG